MEDEKDRRQIHGKIDDVDRDARHAERELLVGELQQHVQDDEIKRQIQPARDHLKLRQAV